MRRPGILSDGDAPTPETVATDIEADAKAAEGGSPTWFAKILPAGLVPEKVFGLRGDLVIGGLVLGLAVLAYKKFVSPQTL